MKTAFEIALAQLCGEYIRYNEATSLDDKYQSLVKCISWIEEARTAGAGYRRRAAHDMRVMSDTPQN